jgi:hypothetical protein
VSVGIEGILPKTGEWKRSADRAVSTATGGPAYLALVVAVAACLVAGCAGTAPSAYVEEPGVPVRVELGRGQTFSGTLIGIEGGAVLVDRSVPKSEYVSVVRRDGRDVVYVDGVAVGTAVEVRGVDILVRERLDFFEIERMEVVSRAYFGWGTGIAAVLAFFLVQILQDLDL